CCKGGELPVEYLKVMVRNGFNSMPAFPASYVDDAALAELSKYLASLPPPMRARRCRGTDWLHQARPCP
ncbi:MAG: cytochrome c, partial [Dokdonella sp.]